MLQHLGRFQLLITLTPAILPVKGEAPEGKEAETKPSECAVCGAVQNGQ